jgi:hypothetical protein
MAVSLTHTTVAVGTDAGNGEIAKAQWNENHTLTLAASRLLGRATASNGAVEEIPLGSGLSFISGALAVTAAGGTTTIINQTNTTDFKDSVQAATTANINLSNPGTAVFDGITLTTGMRLLVKNQSTPSQNGIYTFDTSSTALTRATDADASSEVTSGLLVLVEDGTTQANTLFTLTTPDPITLGTTSLTFESIVVPSNPEIVKAVTAATYTLIATDGNRWLQMNRATAQTVTVPANSSVRIPVNTVLWLQQYGAGAVTLSAAGGVTIRSAQGLATNTQYAAIRLKKIATNEWSVSIIGNTVTAAVKPFIVFKPNDNEPPTANFATLAARNNHPKLDFDQTTQETAIFSSVLPTWYSGGGLTVEVWWTTTVTSGTVGWDVAIERIDTGSLDIDADSFAAAQTITAATVPATSGQVTKTSVAISSGANMDSLAAGEAFRLRVRRDVANDTAAADAELLRVVVRET